MKTRLTLRVKSSYSLLDEAAIKHAATVAYSSLKDASLREQKIEDYVARMTAHASGINKDGEATSPKFVQLVAIVQHPEQLEALLECVDVATDSRKELCSPINLPSEIDTIELFQKYCEEDLAVNGEVRLMLDYGQVCELLGGYMPSSEMNAIEVLAAAAKGTEFILTSTLVLAGTEYERNGIEETTTKTHFRNEVSLVEQSLLIAELEAQQIKERLSRKVVGSVFKLKTVIKSPAEKLVDGSTDIKWKPGTTRERQIEAAEEYLAKDDAFRAANTFKKVVIADALAKA